VSSSIPGTNVPPVSFPGIASGIDYNSIISKLTSMTLAPTVQLNQQIATLNAANAELIKINSMLASLQNALTGLSQPNVYSAFSATSSEPNLATAQGISGTPATPGTYTIQQTQLATSTQILSNPAVGQSETNNVNSPAAPATSVPLAQSYTAITPTNGSTGTGQLTIDGVAITYDVSSQSLSTILSNIQSQVRAATGDNSFTVSLGGATGDVVSITSNNPISLGSASDTGNLLAVLRLDQAQVNNTPGAASVTGTAGVGGINQTLELNSTNSSGYATNANFVTPVTAGTFTINGVAINVDPTKDNLASVLTRINNSAAGVVATYNRATGQISLTNKATGPQGIVLGASSDTSNFLSAAGLTGAGVTTTIGSQAKVVLQTPSGGTQTFYSNSNNVTTAIPGVQINLLAGTNAPFEITVSQDSTQLVSALNNFVSAYNTAVNEIDQATAPPVVTAPQGPQLLGAGQTQQISGGVLWNNSDVASIRNELENIVSGMVQGNGASYNSLSTIGLQLDDSFTILAQNNSTGSAGSTTSTLQTQTLQGTSGQLQPLDAGKLQAALAANPSAVQNLLAGAQGIVNQLGSYLTNVTGVPTSVSSGLLGQIPSVSLIQGFENANTSNIESIQQQIKQIQDNANQQADQLRAEFVSSESQIAGYQSLQTQLGSFFKSSGG
jgi:flagellar hook-associated protein 2